VKPVECEFESDVLAAALQSRWPDGVDEQMRAHVSMCAICSDVVAVAGAIDASREEMRASAMVPDSGRVWWLAKVRARREAAETAGRPITVAQLLAFASAVGLLGACLGATSTWFQSALRSIRLSVGGLDLRTLIPSATTLLAEHAALAVAIAALLFVVPAAVYLAMGRE
jgi:hypothetical protein